LANSQVKPMVQNFLTVAHCKRMDCLVNRCKLLLVGFSSSCQRINRSIMICVQIRIVRKF